MKARQKAGFGEAKKEAARRHCQKIRPMGGFGGKSGDIRIQGEGLNGIAVL